LYYKSLESSFSAGSKVTIATKYSFFQVFRDLQNYLAKFSKFLQILQKKIFKISDFRKDMHLFCQNPAISQNFAKFCDFCKILQLFKKKISYSK